MGYGLWQRRRKGMALCKSYQSGVHINAYTCFYDDFSLYMAEEQIWPGRLGYHSGASAGYRQWVYQCMETAEKVS